MIEQIRASKIVIDMPKSGSEPWVHLTVQKVLRDVDTYEIKNVVTRFGSVSVPLSKILVQEYPVGTVANTSISGVEVFNSISAFVITLLMERYGGTLNEKMDIIL